MDLDPSEALLLIIIGAFVVALQLAILHAIIKSALRSVMQEHHEWLQGWEAAKREAPLKGN